jgi:hypothetical protein
MRPRLDLATVKRLLKLPPSPGRPHPDDDFDDNPPEPKTCRPTATAPAACLLRYWCDDTCRGPCAQRQV